MSCPSLSLCAGIDDAGRLVTTRAPGKRNAHWNASTVPRLLGGLEPAISCTAAPFCLASDVVGQARSVAGRAQPGFISVKPNGGARAWRYTGSLQLPLGGRVRRLRACVNRRRACLGEVFGGFVVTIRPRRRPGHKPQERTQLLEGTRTSCPIPSFCVSSDFTGLGFLATTHHPLNGGRSSWHRVLIERRVAPVDRPQITAVACPSARLCVAGDDHGNVLVSRKPTKSSGWRLVGLSNAGIAKISCPSTSFCVVLTGSGDVFESARPSARAWAWQRSMPDPISRITTVACPTARLCVAGDDDGNVLLGRRR